MAEIPDDVLAKVFGQTDLPREEAIDGEVWVAGYRLDSLSTGGALAALSRISAEAEEAKRRWQVARRARFLAVYYVWANREDIPRKMLMEAVGVSSKFLSQLVDAAREHIRIATQNGKDYDNGTHPLKAPSHRDSPPWAHGTDLDDAVFDWTLHGGVT